MKTVSKSGMLFVSALVLFAGLLGACSSRAPQSNNTTSTSNTSNVPATTINVSTSEMQITFDQTPTRAGRYTFVVTNRGKIEHDFVLNGGGVSIKTKKLAPGATETITADLPAGNYDFVCTVIGHSFAGMRGNFTLN